MQPSTTSPIPGRSTGIGSRIALLFLGVIFGAQGAVVTDPAELSLARQWVGEHLEADSPQMPFSFVYDDQLSDRLLVDWPKTVASRKIDDTRTLRSIIWKDPKSGLEVRCLAVCYDDYPAVEWTVYFKNAGNADTLILRDIQGLDASFQRGEKGEFSLTGIKGDWNVAESFAPYRFELAPHDVRKFGPPGSGKSSDGPTGWPYFNLQMPGKGVIVAVGWPGQWASTFTRDGSTGLAIKAGQELTKLYLKPGEEIRTPLIALMFWQGADVVRAQNLWRRWFVAHNLPRVAGQPPPIMAHKHAGGALKDTATVQRMLDAGIKLDLCWRDAGGDNTWFPIAGGPYHREGKGWWNTGTWQIDPAKYPDGFRPFTNWLHERGVGFMLWFEPERVGDPNSWLAKNHPEWLLPTNALTFGDNPSNDPILDQGNPAALDWLINHVDGMIKSQGIDWYREDMNGRGPGQAWRKNDTPDRQGITENHYVQGHLAFWDELLRRNPRLRIDSCASGGRRNDLESMRRAVPLCRTDFNQVYQAGVAEATQGHTHGLSSWLPYYGLSSRFHDEYSYRSFYMPSFGMIGGDIPVLKKAYGEWREVAADMLGDYYPLTPYSLERDKWIAWQFDRPELGTGMVQVFRRDQSPNDSARLKLHGLDAMAKYMVENIDGGTEIRTGNELLSDGIAVSMPAARSARIYRYHRIE